MQTVEGDDKVTRSTRLAYATNSTLAGVNLVSRKSRRRVKRQGWRVHRPPRRTTALSDFGPWAGAERGCFLCQRESRTGRTRLR
jgi:hypothetical protein